MGNNATLKKDAFLWIGLIFLAMVIAFTLLRRDGQRHFGAMSFGSFPAFEVTTAQGKTFNNHALRSRVWAVLRAQSPDSAMLLRSMNEVRRMTASGKRSLFVLAFGQDQAVLNSPVENNQYLIPVLPENINAAFMRAGAVRDHQVLLIDQETIIRGVYDLTSPDDFRKFRQDVTRLL